ncbi:MAG: M20/M25/M40 family metallo-hydrolase [Capsulimonadaceae bacterium]|nr:M20/M25/M40 family metallo-hydrolase [Capsulimonadaceae bacterium]
MPIPTGLHEAILDTSPSIAVFSHVDTTGFTLGYEGVLIPIGSPAFEAGDAVRSVGTSGRGMQVRWMKEHGVLKDGDDRPGSRFVYAAKPSLDGLMLTAPYLDNRAGLWAALETLRRCPNVVVAFTSGEETSGRGARVCARYLHDEMNIRSALIADITWDTKHVHCGEGPAISLRDACVPNRRFVDKVAGLAAESGIPRQLEIESDGGSDGMHIERGSHPIDWTFVGAPEKFAHSSHECLSLTDLSNMANLLEYLVNHLD